MAWMKIDLELPDKPEVHAIAGMLNIDPDMVVGKLIRVWQWFDKHTTDGNAKSVTEALLDRIVFCNGFATAMCNCGWLVVSEDGISIPQFEKHNGETAKKRAETSRRVSKHRSGGSDKQKTDRAFIPRPLRASVLDRDGHKCVYCDRKEGEYFPPETSSDAVLHIDHVIPLSSGGTDDIGNLVTACTVCNLFKSNRNPDQCGMRWPEVNGVRLGNAKPVTESVPREEKDKNKKHIGADAGFCFKTELLNLGARPELVTDWLAVRSAKKARNTKTALDGFVRELGRSGWNINDALRICCEKNWKGFEAAWVADVKPDAPVVPFDREAYEAKRKAERAAAREAYQRQEEAETVPVARSAP